MTCDVTAGICAGCGGTHRFDTSVPSVVWNDVIQPTGIPEYLCTACIVRLFALANRSFTATLWSAELPGVPIEVRVRKQVANDAHLINKENCTLRSNIYELETSLARLQRSFEALSEGQRNPAHVTVTVPADDMQYFLDALARDWLPPKAREFYARLDYALRGTT